MGVIKNGEFTGKTSYVIGKNTDGGYTVPPELLEKLPDLKVEVLADGSLKFTNAYRDMQLKPIAKKVYPVDTENDEFDFDPTDYGSGTYGEAGYPKFSAKVSCVEDINAYLAKSDEFDDKLYSTNYLILYCDTQSKWLELLPHLDNDDTRNKPYEVVLAVSTDTKKLKYNFGTERLSVDTKATYDEVVQSVPSNIRKLRVIDETAEGIDLSPLGNIESYQDRSIKVNVINKYGDVSISLASDLHLEHKINIIEAIEVQVSKKYDLWGPYVHSMNYYNPDQNTVWSVKKPDTDGWLDVNQLYWDDTIANMYVGLYVWRMATSEIWVHAYDPYQNGLVQQTFSYYGKRMFDFMIDQGNGFKATLQTDDPDNQERSRDYTLVNGMLISNEYLEYAETIVKPVNVATTERIGETYTPQRQRYKPNTIIRFDYSSLYVPFLLKGLPLETISLTYDANNYFKDKTGLQKLLEDYPNLSFMEKTIYDYTPSQRAIFHDGEGVLYMYNIDRFECEVAKEIVSKHSIKTIKIRSYNGISVPLNGEVVALNDYYDRIDGELSRLKRLKLCTGVNFTYKMPIGPNDGSAASLMDKLRLYQKYKNYVTILPVYDDGTAVDFENDEKTVTFGHYATFADRKAFFDYDFQKIKIHLKRNGLGAYQISQKDYASALSIMLLDERITGVIYHGVTQTVTEHIEKPDARVYKGLRALGYINEIKMKYDTMTVESTGKAAKAGVSSEVNQAISDLAQAMNDFSEAFVPYAQFYWGEEPHSACGPSYRKLNRSVLSVFFDFNSNGSVETEWSDRNTTMTYTNNDGIIDRASTKSGDSQCINETVDSKFIKQNADGLNVLIVNISGANTSTVEESAIPQTEDNAQGPKNVTYNLTKNADGSVTITYQNNSDVQPEYLQVGQDKTDIEMGGA